MQYNELALLNTRCISYIIIEKEYELYEWLQQKLIKENDEGFKKEPIDFIIKKMSV
jgi:hypothetical protein